MSTLSPQSLERAASAVGTPFYGYSAPSLRQRAGALQKAVPNAGFVYSLKANPNKSIVRTLAEQGIGAEVCSLFELETAIAAGVCPGRIIFVGPAKSTTDVARAVTYGVKAIIAESLAELAQIDQIAGQLGTVQNVALRVNPAFHTKGARLSMSGKPTQFGIDAEEVDTALATVLEASNIRLAGLHVYMGTRILDYRVVLENTRNILALASDMMAQVKRRFDFVDIGGGFGVPYSAKESPLDLAALGTGLTELIGDFKAAHHGTQILIELGRYMVAEAGVYVTRVKYVKRSKGQNFAICDGGSNSHAAAAQAASFKRNFPVRAVTPRGGDYASWNVSGPLCTPTDLIAQGLTSTELKVGDLIQIDHSGAYGLTFSPAHFLGFASPAEVMIDGEDLHLIRRKGTLEHHLAAQEAMLLPDRLETEEELVSC